MQVNCIDRHSAADTAGLTVDCTAFAGGRTKYCVTEVNGRPLTIFAKVFIFNVFILLLLHRRFINFFSQKGEANERLQARGRDVNVVVQPWDLIQSIKQQLKQMKDYKAYTLE